MKKSQFPMIITAILAAVIIIGCPIELPAPVTHSITFDKNNPAALGSMAPLSVNAGASVNLTLCAFTLTDSTFAGWSAVNDGPVAYGDGASYTIGDEDIVLYAQWVTNGHSVFFLPDDPLATGTMAPQMIAGGGSASLTLCDFSKTGYSFAGWATTSGGAAAYDDGATYTMGDVDVTLYATWEPNNYTITFDKNDPAVTGTMSPQTIACDATANLTLNAFSKTGYSFAGWATTASGAIEYNDGDEYTMSAGDVILYAKWTNGTHNVTFNKNDTAATGTMTPQEIVSGATAALNLCSFSKVGYHFDGWAVTPGGAVEYTDGAEYTMGSTDVTLYAKWSPNIYTVTFDKNDSTTVGSMSPQSIAYGTTAALTTCEYVKIGWTFKYWTSNPSGGMIYYDGANYTMGNANVTVYAQWQINHYTVTFDTQGGSSISPISTSYGNTISEPFFPSKTGFAFVGWYRESSCISSWDFTTDTVTEDTTLYVKWIPATPGLSYASSGDEYIVSKGTADTSGTVIIPEYWLGKKVTSIAMNSFSECHTMTTIEIPNSIISIGAFSFYNCTSLVTAHIPDSVTSLGAAAFSGCTSLSDLTLSAQLPYIDSQTFNGCTSLTSVILPEGLTVIGGNAFISCTAMTNVTLPSTLTTIGLQTFYNCTHLNGIALPAGVTSIGDYAFANCTDLTSISIPEGVTAIANGTFSGCTSLTEISLPNGLISIGNSAFLTCSSLISIGIPSSVTSIGSSAIRQCVMLITITIPASVNTIGSSAFAENTLLSNVYVNADDPPAAGSSIFSSCPQLTAIMVPADSIDIYKTAAIWSTYAARIFAQ